MLDLDDCFKNGFDFDTLREKINAEWEKQGLKDEYLRKSYNATLSKDKNESLFNQAVKLNALTKKLLERGGIFSKKILKRSDDRFLDLINAGLDVNTNLNMESVKYNLLNQSLRMKDFNRFSLLLSAGAKPQIDCDKPQNDSLVIAAHSGDLVTFSVVLAYLDEPLTDHWLLGLLCATQNSTEYVMGQMLARRCEQLGGNFDSLMQKSQDSFKNKFMTQEIQK